MKRITAYIPDAITCCNLLAGCVASIFALQDDFEVAAAAIIVAAVCDFLDGLAARVLDAYSPLGKELDSLSDLVSFGLAPAMMMYALLAHFLLLPYGEYEYVAYVALLIPVAGALRLARFNVDDRQKTSFIGLPIPANALFWIGIAFAGTQNWHPLILPALIVVVSYLMVSPLPMFSLKVTTLSWRENKLRYLLIAASIGLLVWLGLAGLSAAIAVYVLLSLVALLWK